MRATTSLVVADLSELPVVAEDIDGGHSDVYRPDSLTGETMLVTRPEPELDLPVWFGYPSHVAILVTGQDIMLRSKGPYFITSDNTQKER